MKRIPIALGLLLLTAPAVNAQTPGNQEPSWYVNAEHLYGDSCDMFCRCFFDPTPEMGFCRFNEVIQVKKGHYGSVKLDGMKIWHSGDLGSDFGDGDMDASVYTFEPGAPQEQVEAALKVLAHVTPLKVKQFAVDRAPIVWERSEKSSYAKLGDSQAELKLTAVEGADGPVVIQNLWYWPGDRVVGGIHVHYSTHHYKGHGLDYAFQNTSGFTMEIEAGTP